MYEGMISNSYARGRTESHDNVGGLVGRVYWYSPLISNSYSTGYVSGDYTSEGGLIGMGSADVRNCFWDRNTSGVGTSNGGTPKDTADMKTQSTFTDAGWDFDSIWCMLEDVTYPVLLWQDKEPPIADAGPDQTVDEGTLVTFDGSGATDDLWITNITWSLTDGAAVTLSGVSPAHLFDDPGAFVVTQTVTDQVGRQSTDAMTVTVNDITPPTADAGADLTVDEGALMTFNGTGCLDNVGIVNYTWTFVDGALITLYGAQPSYRFDVPGAFEVTLNVTDAVGLWGIDGMTVTVVDVTSPVADAGPDQAVDEGTVVALDGSGSTDNVGIVNYTWTLTAGAPVALFGARPTYLFEDPGTFVVTLNVTDAEGNWGTDEVVVTVNDASQPVADAGPDHTVVAGTVVTFDGSGSLDNVGIAHYAWTFTDGAPVALSEVRPTYRFDSPGVFTVSLNVTDAAGNWDTDEMTVTVEPSPFPVAEAGEDQAVDQGTTVTLDGSGSSDSRGIVGYNWTFTDDALVALHGARSTYKFDAPGLFLVTLNVTNSLGNWDTDTVTIAVRDTTPPVADAGPDLTVDPGALVTFDGRGSHDNVGIVNYTWDIDCGGGTVVLYGALASFTFDAPDLCLVVLRVLDAAGNLDTDAMTLDVGDHIPPVANAGPDRTVPAGATVTLDGSLSTDSGAMTYSWNLTYDGVPRSLSGVAAQFTFDEGGVYEVVLTVTDAWGNRGNDTVVVTVVDTGTVTGTVLDEDGKAVEGATVRVDAADGRAYTATTAANGSFALSVFHGPFNWSISKDGYEAISGSSSVNAMQEADLDLSGTPLVREGGEAPARTSLIVRAVVIVLAAVAVALLALDRRRKDEVGGKGTA